MLSLQSRETPVLYRGRTVPKAYTAGRNGSVSDVRI